jgi:hypothetical protein
MATEEIKLDLQQVIQDCLTSKLQAGFDANAKLTVDIARQVATEIEARASDYTDEEIAKLKDLIGEGVDLKPIQEFMALMKELLDGDESTEKYDIFSKLVSDTAENKASLISHTSSIALIQQTLVTFNSTLSDHENRLKALEALDHTKIDCGECEDGILTLMKDITTAACDASNTAITAYTEAKSGVVSASFADELDPISSVFSADADVNGKVTLEAVFVTGRRVVGISTALGGNTPVQVPVTSEEQEFAVEGTYDPKNPARVSVFTVDKDGLQVGTFKSVIVSYEFPITTDPVVDTGDAIDVVDVAATDVADVTDAAIDDAAIDDTAV